MGVCIMANSTANVLIKHEEKMSREQAATLLESIAAKLKEKGELTINVGDQSETIEPAENVKLEIELEEKNGEYELEFEIEWKENDNGQQQLSIE